MNGEPEGWAELSLWRNYRAGAVGIETPGRGRHLLEPERARAMADDLEAALDGGEWADISEQGERETRRMIDDLRRFADDVEGAGE